MNSHFKSYYLLIPFRKIVLIQWIRQWFHSVSEYSWPDKSSHPKKVYSYAWLHITQRGNTTNYTLFTTKENALVRLFIECKQSHLWYLLLFESVKHYRHVSLAIKHKMRMWEVGREIFSIVIPLVGPACCMPHSRLYIQLNRNCEEMISKYTSVLDTKEQAPGDWVG